MHNMNTVQTQEEEHLSNRTLVDENSNSSTTSTSNETKVFSGPGHITKKINKYYRNNYPDNVASDNEIMEPPKRPPRLQSRSHHRSMGNINEKTRSKDFNRNLNSVQNSMSNIDISFHKQDVKKYDILQVPIVGYEVMEERARFTIYKLKVEDDKSDQSWLVFRRYTDFVRLFSRIKAELPNIILPLPGKRWFRDNFENAFLEDRVRGLQVFVNAILTKLPNHPVVREFFCLDEPPQVLSYQPEVQAVYGALEDSITSMKLQLKQKDSTIVNLHKRLAELESKIKNCSNCNKP